MLKFLRFGLGIDSVQTHPRGNSENTCFFNEVSEVTFFVVVNELFLNPEVINIFYLQRNSLQLILTLVSYSDTNSQYYFVHGYPNNA